MLYEAAGPVKKAVISGVTGSNQTLVASVAGKKIRLISLLAAITANGTVTLHDNASTPNALTGTIPVNAGAPLELPYHPSGWGDTAVDQALEVDVGTSTINGVLVYQEID